MPTLRHFATPEQFFTDFCLCHSSCVGPFRRYHEVHICIALSCVGSSCIATNDIVSYRIIVHPSIFREKCQSLLSAPVYQNVLVCMFVCCITHNILVTLPTVPSLIPRTHTPRPWTFHASYHTMVSPCPLFSTNAAQLHDDLSFSSFLPFLIIHLLCPLFLLHPFHELLSFNPIWSCASPDT